MQKHLVLASVAVGFILTVITARIDDAIAVVGWARVPPLEIAADADSILVRRRGLSSVELSFSQVGSGTPVSASEIVDRADRATWTDNALAGMGAAGWSGAVQHQVLHLQGWPMRAFSATATGTSGLQGGITLSGQRSARTVAFTPEWIGLSGNTLLYGGAFWLMVVGYCKARRALRRRAGRCESCAYPVASLAKCPECGRVVER